MHRLQAFLPSFVAAMRQFGVCVVLSGCATAPGLSPAAPRQLAELESSLLAGRADYGQQLRLATAYLHDGRNEESAQLLERLVAAPGEGAAAAYFLALAYERLDRPADARAQYAQAVARGAPGGIRQTARRRMAVLERAQLEAAVKLSLQQERELKAEPSAGTVGVFPFVAEAGSPLSPLGRALAELLTHDLSQTSRVRVVERAQVQHLLDEIELAGTGVVDAQTAARAGRLLGAGRVLQGRLDGGESDLRIQALLAAVETGALSTTPLAQAGALQQVMTLQNNLALDIYTSLGIELTVAERERVLRQPTRNVQALLAFGLGLEAEDSGRYAEAVGHYGSASEMDPAFAEATAAFERATAHIEAAADSDESLLADGTREFAPELLRLFYRLSGVETMIPSPGRRDPVLELLGTEGFDRRALLDLTIRRPQ